LVNEYTSIALGEMLAALLPYNPLSSLTSPNISSKAEPNYTGKTYICVEDKQYLQRVTKIKHI